jgi:hypothetical protein
LLSKLQDRFMIAPDGSVGKGFAAVSEGKTARRAVAVWDQTRWVRHFRPPESRIR